MSALNLIIATCLIIIAIVIIIWAVLFVVCIVTVGFGCGFLASYTEFAPKVVDKCWQIADKTSQIEEAIFDKFPITETLCLVETLRIGMADNRATVTIPYPIMPCREEGVLQCGVLGEVSKFFGLKLPVRKGTLSDLCNWVLEKINELVDGLGSLLGLESVWSMVVDPFKDELNKAMGKLCGGESSSGFESPDHTESINCVPGAPYNCDQLVKLDCCQKCYEVLDSFWETMERSEEYETLKITGTAKWRKYSEWMDEEGGCHCKVEMVTKTSSSGHPRDLDMPGRGKGSCWVEGGSSGCMTTIYTLAGCNFKISISSSDLFGDDAEFMDEVTGEFKFPFPYILIEEEFPFHYNAFSYKYLPSNQFMDFKFGDQPVVEKPNAFWGPVAATQVNLCSRGQFSAFWLDWDARIVPITRHDEIMEKLEEFLMSVGLSKVQELLDMFDIDINLQDYMDKIQKELDKVVTH